MKQALSLICMVSAACGASATGAMPTPGGDAESPGDTVSVGDVAPGDDVTATPGLVRAPVGQVQGVMDGGTWGYLGIPYAQAPTGDLRFKPPVAVSAWTDVLVASAYPPMCPQTDGKGNVVGDEDCLKLNVWADSGLSDAPVLVFVHGGGNLSGSTSDPVSTDPSVHLYGGSDLARRGNVVIVTVQYRLNILGFMTSTQLDGESATGSSGNYGLLDQLAALAWVQANIAAFGGDPRRVLLFGESGGATDVCALVASPLSAGLFAEALIESGGDCAGRSVAQTRTWSTATMHAAGSCDTAPDPLACMRAASLTTLEQAVASTSTAVNAYGHVTTPAGPMVDGYVLDDTPLAVMTAGEHQHVPFVIGINHDETSSPIFNIALGLTEAQYESAIHASFDATIADEVLARYPVASYPSPRRALVAVTTEQQFVCPARRIARAIAASQSEPVYRYYYTEVLNTASNQVLGAPHGFELNFVFQNLQDTTYTMTDNDTTLEMAFLAYWTRFAANGDPNGADVPAWPAYDGATDPYMTLGSPVAAGAGLLTDNCDFWDGLAP